MQHKDILRRGLTFKTQACNSQLIFSNRLDAQYLFVLSIFAVHAMLVATFKGFMKYSGSPNGGCT